MPLVLLVILRSQRRKQPLSKELRQPVAKNPLLVKQLRLAEEVALAGLVFRDLAGLSLMSQLVEAPLPSLSRHLEVNLKTTSLLAAKDNLIGFR